MLNIEVDADNNVISVRPEGPISASEFEALGREIDAYADAHERMPGLLVRLKGLPHWQGLPAMKAHFDMLRNHAMVLPRVAFVTDSMGLSMLPNLADIFIRARVRRFDIRDEEKAIAWVGSPEKQPEGYVLLEGFPDNVIAIRAIGEVTARDYEDRLIPLVRKKARRHGKLRLLMQLGADFESYTAGAMWDDARLGLTHWRSFERIAVVSDIGWVTRSVKMFAPLMPGEVAVFPADAMPAAAAWVTEGAEQPEPEAVPESEQTSPEEPVLPDPAPEIAEPQDLAAAPALPERQPAEQEPSAKAPQSDVQQPLAESAPEPSGAAAKSPRPAGEKAASRKPRAPRKPKS